MLTWCWSEVPCGTYSKFAKGATDFVAQSYFRHSRNSWVSWPILRSSPTLRQAFPSGIWCIGATTFMILVHDGLLAERVLLPKPAEIISRFSPRTCYRNPPKSSTDVPIWHMVCRCDDMHGSFVWRFAQGERTCYRTPHRNNQQVLETAKILSTRWGPKSRFK